jgi:hypothetical protein
MQERLHAAGSVNALDQLRALQAERTTKPAPSAPTRIDWRVEHNLTTGESLTEYDDALVQAALDAPDDYVIAPFGKIRFINAPEQSPAPERPHEVEEMTFGQLLALHG